MIGHHDMGDSGEELLAGYTAILRTHEKKPVKLGIFMRPFYVDLFTPHSDWFLYQEGLDEKGYNHYQKIRRSETGVKN